MKPLPVVSILSLLLHAGVLEARAALRAGAAVVDATPRQLPVLVNGGMLSRSADAVKTPIRVRALVLDDGPERVAMVVADSCMMPRDLLDEAKRLAADRTRMRPDHMLMAATHTHSAPASMGCLGTDADAAYLPLLREKLVEAVVAAEANLEPAQIGWAVANAADYTAVRRWVRRPDRLAADPFGNLTVRANMHAAANWDDVTGPAGPEDPALSLLSVRAADGRPLAVFANFSMHYFGDEPVSADYFGRFCEGFQARVGSGRTTDRPPFVALLSHGCSGDIWLRDYAKPAGSRSEEWTLGSYTEGLLQLAWSAYETITHRDDASLAMAETRLQLAYRVPDKQRLEWAQRIVTAMGARPPRDTTEVYASEQILLHERQTTEVVLQALRLGDIAIATTPTETYALTGLKIKLQSPLARTMVLDLANGGDGYIPPPEQHLLGGYNTWPARSAGLEVQAEPRITEGALQLLERVSGQPRRPFQPAPGPAAQAALGAKPAAYWRLDEFAGPRALDASGHHRDAFYEPGVLFFLEGPAGFGARDEVNRAPHFAGGRLEARVASLGRRSSVSLWFWNGMPPEARPTTGWLYSRGTGPGSGPSVELLGLGGTATGPGRLVFVHGREHEAPEASIGRTQLARWTWNHALVVRDDSTIRVYLNGDSQPEIQVSAPGEGRPPGDHFYFGGRPDRESGWEGRLDEIAVFDRALTVEEVARLAAR